MSHAICICPVWKAFYVEPEKVAHDKAHTKTGKSLSFFRFFVCRGCSFFGPELAVINSKRPASFSLFLPEFSFWGRVATQPDGGLPWRQYIPLYERHLICLHYLRIFVGICSCVCCCRWKMRKSNQLMQQEQQLPSRRYLTCFIGDIGVRMGSTCVDTHLLCRTRLLFVAVWNMSSAIYPVSELCLWGIIRDCHYIRGSPA